MDKYNFREYDSIFVELFEGQKKWLMEVLGGEVEIEHVGSTAVPGLGGKGFIDILVAGEKDDLRVISERLTQIGYEYKPEVGTAERWYHSMDIPDELERARPYHIHLTFKGSRDYKELIAFREYLRSHPQELKRYAEIKKQAATVANQEREIYVRTKEPVILEMIERAIKDEH